MTGSELIIEVSERLALGSSPTATQKSRILRFLNDAQNIMVRTTRFRSLETSGTVATTADTKTYDYPTSTYKVISARVDGQHRFLKVLDAKTFDRYVPDPEDIASGIPCKIVPYGTSFELYPIPNDAYDIIIRYIAKPTSITDSSTEPDLTGMDDIYIAGATWLGLVAERRWEDANQYQGIFRRELKYSVIQDNEMPGGTPILGEYGDSLTRSDPWAITTTDYLPEP